MIFTDFEARNDFTFDQDNQQCKTIGICNSIPCCNRFYVVNKLNDIPIKIGYFKSPFGQNNVDWFLEKINNIEFQMRNFFKLNIKPKITNKSENCL